MFPIPGYMQTKFTNITLAQYLKIACGWRKKLLMLTLVNTFV